MSALIFCRSTRSLSLPLGFRCANIGLANLENGSVVIMPYLCMRASSIVRSSLRLMGTGRLWVYTGLSSFGVRLTLNCVFNPISSLWRAKCRETRQLWLSRSFPVISESVHLNIERNLVRDCSFSVGSSFSSSASSRSSLKIWRCIGKCSDSFPGSSGVGKQNFSSLSSGRCTCISALIYVTTSSCSVKRLSAAMSTGRIIFVSSGLSVCSSVILVSAAIVYGKSVVLATFIATFFPWP